MRFPWLKDVLTENPPFLTVYVDTTRKGASSGPELTTRWEHLRETAERSGAPAGILQQIEDSVLTPAGIPGPHGRAFLATADQLYIDRVLPVPPEESVSWDQRPRLLPLMRVASDAVSQILVEVNRSGADFSLRAPEDPKLTGSREVLGEDSSVEGGHDELRKTHPTIQRGWRAHNFEARVEDSWERNAEAVAEKLDKLVREHRPDLVILTGDVRAANLLKDEVGQETRARLVEVPGGGRTEGIDREVFEQRVAEAVNNFIARREKACVERFIEQDARDGQAVEGIAETRMALKRGQVDELLIAEGSEPKDVEDLLYLALTTDAAVQTIPSEAVSLQEGVGAILRWRDDATASTAVPTMSGDRRRETRL